MLTKIEIFQKVAKHLLTQNAKAEGRLGCRYLTDDGKRCAVGCLLPGNYDTAPFEGFGFNNYEPSFLMGSVKGRRKFIAIKEALRQGGVEVGDETETARENYNLLTRLQRIHDAHQVSEWETELRILATELGTTLPEIGVANVQS